MSKRVMGTEVEYGIAGPGDPVVASTQVVLAYAAAAGVPRNRRARWDYEAESPLRDARGFDLSKPSLAPQRDTDMDDVGAANVILPNGARFYVDHAHPEYSTPEVLTPRDVVVWDKAGERIMLEAANRAATVPDAPRIQLYKNNVDGKGASYGSHENYLMSRATTFPSIVTGLTPFLVSRQVVCGAGRVGLGQQGDEPGFQIAQRSDYIEVEVGLETTLKRGIINTRDEPHADADKYRRLHVIIGDANLSEVATLLKVGTTALVLDMIEHGRSFEDLRLAEPVKSVARISHDLTLHTTIPLADGRRFTALNLQQEYLTRAVAHLEQTAGSRRTDWNPDTREIVEEWESVLADLERDPMLTTDRLDWTAKLQLLEAYRERDGLRWGSGRLGMVDLQYSDVRLAKGLYNRLVTRGSMRRVVTEEEVTAAMTEPPEDTRAYFRGTCLSRYPADVAAASWSSVIFDLDRESLVRIPTPEPLRGTRRHVGELFETVADAAELVDKLTGKQPGAAPADQAGIAGRFWK